jgi:hypothetical protein
VVESKSLRFGIKSKDYSGQFKADCYLSGKSEIAFNKCVRVNLPTLELSCDI